MNKILEKIGELGIVPVVKIEKAEDALPLGKALIDGDLPLKTENRKLSTKTCFNTND